MLDEAIYGVPGIVAYSAEIVTRNNRECLRIKAQVNSGSPKNTLQRISRITSQLRPLQQAIYDNRLIIEVIPEEITFSNKDFVNKRRITDKRNLK
jgi:hypothetical protein